MLLLISEYTRIKFAIIPKNTTKKAIVNMRGNIMFFRKIQLIKNINPDKIAVINRCIVITIIKIAMPNPEWSAVTGVLGLSIK